MEDNNSNTAKPAPSAVAASGSAAKPGLSEPQKGQYAIALAVIVGLAILLGAVWFSGQAFDQSLAQANHGANLNTTKPSNTTTPTPNSTAPNNTQTSGDQNETIDARALILSSPSLGPDNAAVTIYEIADFQCPYCVQAYPTLKQVMTKYNGSVRLVFLHFPLTSIHPYAQKASEAAECAGDQGQFWAYYDKLFTDNKLEVSDLKATAKTLGLDTTKFNTCLDSGAKAKRIAQISTVVTQSGISSTPSFIVNGELLQDRSLEGFSKAIDQVVNPPRAVINTTGQPMRGNASAQVKIVEFSDFQCPYCAMAYGVVKQVEKDYPGQVSVTFMNFPLSFHANAQKAAEASECAYKQKPEAFWQFHDWMFENQTLDVPSLKAHAKAIGLNSAQFDACLDGNQTTAMVAADAAVGNQNGVSGTPSFFINGRAIKTDWRYLSAEIDKELEIAKNASANATRTGSS